MPNVKIPEDFLPPVARDEAFDRDYIPIPGNWEIQTKGKGSTFRIGNSRTGDQIPVIESRLHGVLTEMARDCRKACEAREAQHKEEVDALKETIAKLETAAAAT